MSAQIDVQRFRSDLLGWFAVYQRALPWRRSRDPYAIWISEIMLQQTRVAAVIPFYNRFLEKFPDFKSLAVAAESDLLACWAGLGYYHRARNLQKAAQEMQLSGAFPSTYTQIRQLPGVGDYTAAAVASICFDLPHAALDGNVFRVLSRIFCDETNIASAKGRSHFAELADHLLDRDHPGAFNQAVMELGATVCLPKNPQCLVCPVAALCRARETGKQNELPVKIAPSRTKKEEREIFWIEQAGKLLVWQRSPAERLMPGFWELPEPAHLPGPVEASGVIGSFRHGITIHNYTFKLWRAAPPMDIGGCQWVDLRMLDTLPTSTILRKARKVALRHGHETSIGAAASA